MARKSPSTEAPQCATLPPRGPELPRRRRRMTEPIASQPKPLRRRSDRGERMLTVARRSDGDGPLPMIRIRGGWLAQLGFEIGTRIAVSEERGRIVITLAGEE